MVPIEAGAAPVGCLTLAQSTSGRRFDREDVALATELARRASIAVENARLYEESERSREQAEQAVRSRDGMLAYVSHDLCQPLSVLRSVITVFLRSSLPEEKRRELLGSGRRAVEHADRLIEDLLDVARSDRGRMELRREEVRIGRLIEGVAEDFMEGAGVEVRLEVPEVLPPVPADPERLRRVMANLVSNAVKHSPADGIVTIGARRGEGAVLLSVADTGEGIPESEQPHVFDRYWQGTASGGSGLGLGLSIAREIVDAHGGRIWLESEPERGTTFYVRLPAISADDVEPRGEDGDSPSERSRLRRERSR